MTSLSDISKPLHQRLVSCDWDSLNILVNKYSFDKQTLIRIMSTINEFAKQGQHITPLQASVLAGNYKICKQLILEGADMFSLSYNILHPLNLALDGGRFQIAKLLITSGANVCLAQHGYFPMYFALKPETPEYIIETIINAGFPASSVIEIISNTYALHKAIVCNNIPVIKLLLKYKANVDAVDSNEQYTSLHVAVKQKSPHIVKLLTEYKTNMEIECREGFTPLFLAIMNNDIDCLDTLLQNGANINHLSSVKLIYPLNLAASLCNVKMCEILIKQGADVGLSTPGTGDLPIHSAAMSQKSKISRENEEKLKELVQLLIENGSKIDSPNKYNRTPMQVAIMEENFSIVELLVNEGGTVNRTLDYGTSFHFVARRGSKELITTFLNYGADYSVFDVNKITPYHLAALNPDITILPLFWRYQCPFDLPLQAENSHKPLFPSVIIDCLENQKMFLYGVKCNDINMMSEAILNGAEARGCSLKMPYPLHFASSHGFISVVELLLEKSVPPSLVNSDKETPLHLAAKEGHYDVCLRLLRYGAVFNPKSKTGKTPLDLALQNGHQRVAKILRQLENMFKSHQEKKVISKLEHSINSDYKLDLVFINAVNRKGDTLMKAALNKGFMKLAKLILSLRMGRNAFLFEINV